MNSWHKICANPRSIGLYYANVPPLEDFEVHRIALVEDGSSIKFSGNLARYADRPSPLWDSSNNQIRLVLSMWGISNLKLDGWSPSRFGTLAIIQMGNALKFRFANADMQCSGNFDMALIEQVASYTDESLSIGA